ncbi:MAG: 50S ribosomal protein L18e [Candidatus Aenigmatarchaeota archaeon]
MAKTQTTNPNLMKLVNELENQGKEENLPFLVDLSRRLSKSRKNRATVNISKINRIVNEDETIVVPGKVLSYGKIDKKVNVASFKFSKEARKKISDAGGKCLTIRELVEENPEGTDVRIMK